MAKLIITDNSTGQTLEYSLTKSETKIGRNPNKNDLVLTDRQISSTHALLKRIGTEYMLLDLNSTNGTFVNEERINEQSLHDGDLFTVGNYTIKLSDRAARNAVSYAENPIGQTVVLRPAQVFSENYQTSMLDQNFEQGDLEERLQEKVKILETLYALGRTLSSVFNIDDIFAQVAELLFQITPGDRCAVLVAESNTNTLEPRIIKLNPNRAKAGVASELIISRSITAKVLEERVSLLSVDAQTDKRLSSESIMIQHIHSVMCAPLLGKNGVLGLIYIDKMDLHDSFSSDDLELLNAVASQVAIAVDNASAYERLSQEAIARSSYQRFMPNHIIDVLLESPDGLRLGGKIQPVTILFADIRGFTSMAEKSHPELIVDVLNRFLSSMTEIVFANLGTLDKYIGDGLMALFGAPYSSEDDAINAVNAAIAMQRRLVRLNQELIKLGFSPLQVGIGINTGDVTVGCVGSDRRMDYTAIGNPVNVAARLMAKAQGKQILITESTHDLLDNVFRTNIFGDINLKGISQATKVYQVSYR